MKLIIKNGLVFATHEDWQDVTAAMYGPDATMLTVPNDTVLVRVGEPPAEGERDDRPFAAPPVDLVAYAADKRWRIEIGGILVAGVAVATDDRSKTMVLGARVAAAANPDWETVWHGADGQTYPINATQMIAISDAVEAHVNATFATFAIVKAEIEAGEITTLAEIDAAFAPA